MFCPLPHQKKPLQIFLGHGEIDRAALLFHPNRKVVQNYLPKCNFATVRMFVTSVCSILLKSYAKHKFWKSSHLFPPTSQVKWYLDTTMKLNVESANTYCDTVIIIAIKLLLSYLWSYRRQQTNASPQILEIPTCNVSVKAILWFHIGYRTFQNVFPSSSFPLQS